MNWKGPIGALSALARDHENTTGAATRIAAPSGHESSLKRYTKRHELLPGSDALTQDCRLPGGGSPSVLNASISVQRAVL